MAASSHQTHAMEVPPSVSSSGPVADVEEDLVV
jgi:hypothetical protein